MMRIIAFLTAVTTLLNLAPFAAGIDQDPAPAADTDDEELTELLDNLASRKCRSCSIECLLGSCTACCARPLTPTCTCDLGLLIPRCGCA